MADAAMSPGQDVVAFVTSYGSLSLSLCERVIVDAGDSAVTLHLTRLSGFTLLPPIILKHRRIHFPQFSRNARVAVSAELCRSDGNRVTVTRTFIHGGNK